MRKRFKNRLLPFLLIMVVIANVITPGLIQPSVVYAAEEPADTQQGTEAPSSIVLGKGTIEINGHLFTNAEFQTFLSNAEIIRVPFEKPSSFALGEYEDLVGNGAGTAGGLTVLAGAAVGAFQKLTVMFNLADLAGSSYVAIGAIGGVMFPVAVRFHSDSLEMNEILINSYNKALVNLTNFFADHKAKNPDEEIVVPDTGSGETINPEEGAEGDSDSVYNQAAIDARDTALAEIATWSSDKRQDVTTVAAGYNKTTKQVAVGLNLTSVNHGLICAEDLVVEQLGGIGSINDIIMTPAIRPRTGQIIPVCKRCQTKYPKSSFMLGTPFQ